MEIIKEATRFERLKRKRLPLAGRLAIVIGGLIIILIMAFFSISYEEFHEQQKEQERP